MTTDPTPIGTRDISRLLPPSIAARVASGELTPEAPPRGWTADDERERLAAVEAHRRGRYDRRLPSRYRHAALADLTPEQNPRSLVSSWWASGHQTLLLFSRTPGNGKTHTLYAVCNDAVAAGAWAEACTSTELLSDLRPEGDPEGAMRRAVTCDLLGLDDLGREIDNGSGWSTQQLQHILNTRTNNGLRQVVTTNLADNEMSARYSATLIDRLVDDAYIVRVEGDSRRRPARW